MNDTHIPTQNKVAVEVKGGWGARHADYHSWELCFSLTTNPFAFSLKEELWGNACC